MPDTQSSATSRPTRGEIKREIRALRYIEKHLGNVSPAGKWWLRERLTADLERRP